VSAPLLGFLGVLLGAGVAALTNVITALATARLTERRETRARLFDVRRWVYVDALRAVSIARQALVEPVPEDAIDVRETSQFMAQLELLGSPEVFRAYGRLLDPLTLALEGNMRIEERANVLNVIRAAEAHLRDFIWGDLGGAPLGFADLPSGPDAESPPPGGSRRPRGRAAAG